MSELKVILLVCLLRALLVAGLLSGWNLKNWRVLKTIAISLVLSSLFLMVILMLFKPDILAVAFLIETEWVFNVGFALFVIAFFITPLVIEVKTNLAMLNEEYPVQHIRRSTLGGHVFSTAMILLWLWMSFWF
jgi:hypothetical protein